VTEAAPKEEAVAEAASQEEAVVEVKSDNDVSDEVKPEPEAAVVEGEAKATEEEEVTEEKKEDEASAEDNSILTEIKDKRVIDLQYMNLAENHVDELVTYLQSESTSIESLLLQGCSLGHANITSILKALIKSKRTVGTLNLATNDLEHNSINYILKAVIKCQISSLVLDGNSLEDKGTRILMKGLARQVITEKEKNSDTSSLSSQSSSASGSVISLDFSPSSLLQSLSLDNIQIEEKGLKSIAAFLSLNPPLKSLSLNENDSLGDKLKLIWKVFAKGRNKNLTSISLSGNKMVDDDLDSFFELMAGETSIESICLTNNEFEEEGSKKLADFASSNNITLFVQ